MFCYTTLHEGLPNALLEAIAAGLPVVTTNFAGVDELIEGGINSKTIAINDVDEAYLALKSYMDNPAIANKLAEKHKKLFDSSFP